MPYGTRRHHGTFSSASSCADTQLRSTPVRLPARIGGRLFGVGSCFAWQMNRDELGLDPGGGGEADRATFALFFTGKRAPRTRGASSPCPRNVHCCVLNWSSGETGLDFVLLRSFNFY